MVILIGGVSCSGKTVLAQKIMEKYNIPYMSMDHLKMGLIRTGTSKYLGKGFDAESTDEEITEELWIMIKEIIETNIENNQNIIIEGSYILENNIKDFPNEYLKVIVPVYIIFSKEYINNHFDDGILKHLCEIEYKEIDNSYMTKDYFVEKHTEKKNKCEKNGIKYFEIWNNYEADIQSLILWIDRKISEKKEEKFDIYI